MLYEADRVQQRRDCGAGESARAARCYQCHHARYRACTFAEADQRPAKREHTDQHKLCNAAAERQRGDAGAQQPGSRRGARGGCEDQPSRCHGARHTHEPKTVTSDFREKQSRVKAYTSSKAHRHRERIRHAERWHHQRVAAAAAASSHSSGVHREPALTRALARASARRKQRRLSHPAPDTSAGRPAAQQQHAPAGGSQSPALGRETVLRPRRPSGGRGGVRGDPRLGPDDARAARMRMQKHLFSFRKRLKKKASFVQENTQTHPC